MLVLLIMHGMTEHYTNVRLWYQCLIPDTTIFVVSGVIKCIKKEKKTREKKYIF